jgi:hypothetical protein
VASPLAIHNRNDHYPVVHRFLQSPSENDTVAIHSGRMLTTEAGHRHFRLD